MIINTLRVAAFGTLAYMYGKAAVKEVKKDKAIRSESVVAVNGAFAALSAATALAIASTFVNKD